MRFSEINALLMQPADDVVTLTEAVKAGDAVCWRKADGICSVAAAEGVPQYHKVAVAAKEKGEIIRKYGERIGNATADIAAGAWVHTHNLSDVPEGQK